MFRKIAFPLILATFFLLLSACSQTSITDEFELDVLTFGQGTDGCSQGFWTNKNGLKVWPSSVEVIKGGGLVSVAIDQTSTTLGDVFKGLKRADVKAALGDDLSDDLLIDALNYPGGSGYLGAAKILLRQAVAGLLNAATYPNTYGWPVSHTFNRTARVAQLTNNALVKGLMDTSIMTSLTSIFNSQNIIEVSDPCPK